MSKRDWRTGDSVRIVCGGIAATATVLMASSNGNSMMLGFEAVIDGHVGMMPVLRDDDGVYRSIVTDIEVAIKGEQ